jgi:hypothetical protein
MNYLLFLELILDCIHLYTLKALLTLLAECECSSTIVYLIKDQHQLYQLKIEILLLNEMLIDIMP